MEVKIIHREDPNPTTLVVLFQEWQWLRYVRVWAFMGLRNLLWILSMISQSDTSVT
jgi:hypothetical protein